MMGQDRIGLDRASEALEIQLSGYHYQMGIHASKARSAENE